jgi:hypothetical protein
MITKEQIDLIVNKLVSNEISKAEATATLIGLIYPNKERDRYKYANAHNDKIKDFKYRSDTDLEGSMYYTLLPKDTMYSLAKPLSQAPIWFIQESMPQIEKILAKEAKLNKKAEADWISQESLDEDNQRILDQIDLDNAAYIESAKDQTKGYYFFTETIIGNKETMGWCSKDGLIALEPEVRKTVKPLIEAPVWFIKKALQGIAHPTED